MSIFRWVLSRILTPLDMKLKGTPFAPSTFGVDMPLCFLTTTGRKSGEERTVPLLYVTTPEDLPVVAATNFGQSLHPGWALNLEADSRALLEVDGRTRQVVAHRATPAQVIELWPLFDDIWPAYEEYRKIAPRDIKVFILKG